MSGLLQSPYVRFFPRTLVEADDVAGWIEQARSRYGIEGVTFLGGEPVPQARGLARVAQLIRPLGLSVMLFTGYRLEELAHMGLPGVEELLGLTDLVVDGPFIASRPELVRNWVGSTHQRCRCRRLAIPMFRLTSPSENAGFRNLALLTKRPNMLWPLDFRCIITSRQRCSRTASRSCFVMS